MHPVGLPQAAVAGNVLVQRAAEEHIDELAAPADAEDRELKAGEAAHQRQLCAVALLIWASGGLHLDGLADTADALFANRSREKTLAIMRDSAVGTGGVIAIVLDILGKWVLLVELAAASSSETAAVALLAAPMGRKTIERYLALEAAGLKARCEAGA